MDLVRTWLWNWNRFKCKIKMLVGGIGSSSVPLRMSPYKKDPKQVSKEWLIVS